MRSLTCLLVLSMWCACLPLIGQDSLEVEKKWFVDGYVKDLVTLNLIRGFDSAWVENQIHHRLNFKWYPSSEFSAYVEIRNRIFWGDFAKNIPIYDQLVDLNNDVLDLSVVWVDEGSWVLHSMIDRAYVEWNHEDWEVRLGRQRINWGVALVWNPNDLFNAFSFFDFDYEERPGSDGIRIKKYTGFASSVELASNITDDIDELTSAFLWKINKGQYDFQFLVGKALEDLAFGAGWAGNIGDGGFKGEITYLHPYTSNQNHPVLLASLSGDYSFASSFYLHGAFFLNTEGSQNPNFAFLSQRLGRLNVRNLSPYIVSSLLQTSYSFSPLINGGIALIYYPGSNALFLNPSMTVSLKENLDLDLIGQFFFDTPNEDYKPVNKFLFFRLKWSY
ncbi:MAG: hypothetical protein OER04_07860 [Cyclobacteriaceae bacterium]|nr:hypothetical protein [Cyclobacteriaceae bacterium]